MKGYSYQHWEYRTPSTWLVHPWLAYTYLALAKLSLLNWEHVVALSGKDGGAKVAKADLDILAGTAFNLPGTNGNPAKTVSSSKNSENAELFAKRLKALRSLPLATSPDLRELDNALERCFDRRKQWFSQPGIVDVMSWKRLLV